LENSDSAEVRLEFIGIPLPLPAELMEQASLV